MAKTGIWTIVAFLSIAGTAYAAAPASPNNAAPGRSIEKGTIFIGDIGGDMDLGTATYARVPGTWGDQEQITLTGVSIPLCEGPDCQKEFRFHLDCVDAAGYSKEVLSPYYKNYATEDDDSPLVYTFDAPGITDCEEIPSITIDWKYGWDDAVD